MSKYAKPLLLLVAAFHPLAYAYVALRRMGHPFDLEWMEGAVLMGVERILSQQPLFAAPSLDYVPLMYGPLYFHVGAVFSSLLGESLGSLRLLSFLSSLGCFVFIFLIVRLETGSRYWGAIAACLFAGTFRISGSWFDLARVDSLFVALLLAGIYCVRRDHSRVSGLLAGCVLSLSFLAKQPALAISVPIVLYAAIVDRALAARLAGTMAALIGGSTLLLDRLYDGWYSRFVFDLPRQAYERVDRVVLEFWTTDLMGAFPIAFYGAAFYLAYRLSREGRGATGPWSWLRSLDASSTLFLLALTGGMVGASWVQRSSVGGAQNVLMPAYASVSIVSVIALRETLQGLPGSSARGGRWMELGLYALALVQLVLLVYVPNRELPTRESLAAGQRLVERLAAVDGEVLIPYQPHLATLAGKTPHAHVSAVGWLLMTSDTEPKTRVYREFERAFEEQRFRAVVSNDDWPRTFESFERNYREAGAVFANPDVFWCLTGVPTRPQTVFEPVGASPGGWTPIPD